MGRPCHRIRYRRNRLCRIGSQAPAVKTAGRRYRPRHPLGYAAAVISTGWDQGVTEQEGVIQFSYALDAGDTAIDDAQFSRLAAWRSVLRDLQLLGEDPLRYGGFGYGNLSVRHPDGGFVITASQTSGLATLGRAQLVHITRADLADFRVQATGAMAPSSESLTHAMLYQADPRLNVVFHIHCPLIWRARDALGIPATAGDVPYGTPAMAQAVRSLLARESHRPLLFATAGHEDGVFAAGATCRECGTRLVSALADARAVIVAERGDA